MPDFTLEPQASASFSLMAWTDPASVTRPSRVTDALGRGRFAWTARVDQPFEIWARVDGGVAGADDGSLSGRLFSAWLAEAPAFPLAVMHPLGWTSRARIVCPLPGHLLVVVARPSGGRVAIHVDVIDPAATAPP